LKRNLLTKFFQESRYDSVAICVFPLKDLSLSLHLYKLLHRFEFISGTKFRLQIISE